ncbi:hypothetical protein [Bacteroides sp.]|uniref:hypothetical protein n=1 Tax=Bacteroides sp. TaxID=29523 RepID=UPI00258CDD93|nr:hypothetical protein [Bacteroides sp.]
MNSLVTTRSELTLPTPNSHATTSATSRALVARCSRLRVPSKSLLSFAMSKNSRYFSIGSFRSFQDVLGCWKPNRIKWQGVCS